MYDEETDGMKHKYINGTKKVKRNTCTDVSILYVSYKKICLQLSL